MTSRGIVSADEIRRRIAACGGDIKDTDLKVGGRVKPVPLHFVPTRRIGHGVTRKELVSEYVRYLTEIHERRQDLLNVPAEQRNAHILAEAEKAAARHFTEKS
uniref:Uncharacterized protein n=1 Tax=Dulem virus 38 TaxID=3145756 RepID=A0AAU8B1I6_9CAUD